MASKLEAFLSEKKIDRRRLIAASRKAERLRPEDRAIRLVQRQARMQEDGKKPEGLAKPRSGRPVTQIAIDKVYAGKPVSGPTKNRILRAINQVLELRKQKPVEYADLF